MFKKRKILISAIIIVLILIIIGVIYLININSKKRISDNIINYIEDNISSENTNFTKQCIDDNISKVTKEAATEMVTLYENYQDKNIERLYNEFKEKIIEYNGQYTVDTLNNIENITDDELKNILTDIRTNGYKLKKVWGDIIVVKDYSQFKEYTQYVTEDKKIYIDIQNKYEEQLYSYKDIKSLLDTIIETENNILKVKDKEIKKEISNIYVNMLLLIIQGDEIYVPKAYGEEESKTVNETIQTYINNNSNTITANILSKYISALIEDNYEYRDSSIKLVDEIKNNINSYFEK